MEQLIEKHLGEIKQLMKQYDVERAYIWQPEQRRILLFRGAIRTDTILYCQIIGLKKQEKYTKLKGFVT